MLTRLDETRIYATKMRTVKECTTYNSDYLREALNIFAITGKIYDNKTNGDNIFSGWMTIKILILFDK